MNSDVLDAIDKQSEPFVTATEIGEELNVSNTAILERLHELHENGKVESKKVGANTLVWWRS